MKRRLLNFKCGPECGCGCLNGPTKPEVSRFLFRLNLAGTFWGEKSNFNVLLSGLTKDKD